MAITIPDIESKEFSKRSPGYDFNEVDSYLDAICDEMELMQIQIANLQKSLRAAEAQRPPVPVVPASPTPAAAVNMVDDDIREILEMTQRLKNETLAKAQKKADELENETRQKMKAELADLTAERDRLTNEVVALRQTAANYRARFEQMLTEQAQALQRFDM